MEVSEDTLKLFCKNVNITEFLPGTDRLQKIYLYYTNGNLIATSDEKGLARFRLSSGTNKFGIYICGHKNNKPNKYYDFIWVKVNNKTEHAPDYNRCGVSIYFATRYTYTTPDTSYERETYNNHFGTWPSYPGSFSGNTFSASYQYNPLYLTGSITATFNSDFTITNITWTEGHTREESNGSTMFVGSNIPLDQNE